MSNDEYKETTCIKCLKKFQYKNTDCRFYEFAGYSQKVIQCPECNTHNVVQTIEDRALYVNDDSRYY